MPAADDWQTWFDRHGAALVLLARQFVNSHSDAEDIVQEAFVRFWRSRDRVAEPAAFVFACVRRCAFDWQRSRRRQGKREEQAARPESLFVAPGEHDERHSAIEAALRELPLEQAEVVVMKIWGRLSFPQIAQAIDVSPNTAASRYRYAIEKLRTALAEEYSVEEPSYE
jgi:RNA polymerase sigma-70 factor (ECF subfamily)